MSRKIAIGTIMLLMSTNVTASPQIFNLILQGVKAIGNKQMRIMTDNLEAIKKQLDLEEKIVNKTKEALGHIDRMANDMSGHYDLGKIFNGAVDQAKRRWGPDFNGEGGGEQYQFLRNQHQGKYKFMSSKEIYGSNAMLVNSYEQRQNVQERAIVSSQFVVNDINNNMTNIESMMKEIDKTENIKASMDLNTRIQGQLAIELVHLKQIQALQLEAMGTQVHQKVVNENMSAKFNRWT